MSFTDWLIEKYFGLEKEIIFHLGPGPAVGTLFVNMPTKQFWERESVATKIKSILAKRWSPKELYLQQTAGEILATEVFGSDQDYGEQLYANLVWFYHKQWKPDQLSSKDLEKAEALEAMTLLTRLRLGKDYIPLMALKMKTRSELVCGLTHMMLIKIPVISFQFFLDIDCRFSFHSIRKARHPQADDLIAFLYDLLAIQQKIAVSFHELLLNLNIRDKKSESTVMTHSVVNAVMNAEQILTYLKASIEKTVSLLAYIFSDVRIEDLKTHKKRINKLNLMIPDKVKKNDYYDLIREFISSDNLEKLNSIRSGLLHKKGLASLQPHSHYGEEKNTSKLKELFIQLHDQHAVGTAVLLCTLAILTDDLVDRDKPEIDPFVLLYETNKEFRDRVDLEIKEKENPI